MAHVLPSQPNSKVSVQKTSTWQSCFYQVSGDDSQPKTVLKLISMEENSLYLVNIPEKKKESIQTCFAGR